MKFITSEKIHPFGLLLADTDTSPNNLSSTAAKIALGLETPLKFSHHVRQMYSSSNIAIVNEYLEVLILHTKYE